MSGAAPDRLADPRLPRIDTAPSTRVPEWSIGALAALTLVRLAVAGLTPLSPDEAYYWVWARAPAASYLDHPPMVAWFIALGTALAGDGALGVRLLAPVAACLGTWALADCANRLFPAARPGLAAALLMNATLLFGVGGVTMTPDTPLLLFWTLTLALVARAAARPALWPLAGAALGAALLSKYTAVLLAAAVLLWVAASPQRRGWLRAPWIWTGALGAAACCAPVLLWNAGHGWASLAKQGGRAGDWRPARAAQYLGELLAGQIGLATPLVWLLCAAGLVVAARRLRDPAWALLACAGGLPALVFAEHALGDRVQANWVAVAYPAGVIAAAAIGSPWAARLTMPAMALGAAITALVWTQGLAAPLKLPRSVDPTLMRLAGWPAMAAAVLAQARGAQAAFVADDSYGDAAVLARLLPADLAVLGVDARWALFALPSGAPLIAGRAGLLVRSARRADPPDPADWASIAPAGNVVRARDGVVAETYRLYRVVGAAAPAVAVAVMPRPR